MAPQEPGEVGNRLNRPTPLRSTLGQLDHALVSHAFERSFERRHVPLAALGRRDAPVVEQDGGPAHRLGLDVGVSDDL